MPNKTPYVTAALVCEKVLQEKDGVLTAVRIVDQIIVQRPPDNLPNLMSVVQLIVLVMIKSGDVTGPSSIEVRLRSPSGKIRDLPEKYSSILTGGIQGQNLVITLLLEIKDEFGMFWVDVHWNGEMLASIPFNLVEGPPAATKPEKG